MWKGRFPSRKAQFCTEELKRNVAVAFQLDRMEAGYNVLSWQGVRRDESENRRHAKKFDESGRGLRIARPIVDATAADVFRAGEGTGHPPEPPVSAGHEPRRLHASFNCNKAELRFHRPALAEHPQRIAEWEWIVASAPSAGFDIHDGRPPGERPPPDLR